MTNIRLSTSKTVAILFLFLAGLGIHQSALAKSGVGLEEKDYLRAVVQIESSAKVGSGFFVNSDGILVTAEHVIGNEKVAKVKLSNGEYAEGVVVSTDKDIDLAVLKTNLINTPFLKLGASDRLKVGEKVSLLGSPIGLDHSVIQATIAALKRQVEKNSFLQLDGNVNSGLSGGAVVNRNGEVVGLVDMKAERAQGIGFAIPVEDLFKYLESINVATVSALPERQFQKRNLHPSDDRTIELRTKWPLVLAGAAILMLLSSLIFWRAMRAQKLRRVPSNVTKLPIKRDTYDDVEISLSKEVRR